MSSARSLHVLARASARALAIVPNVLWPACSTAQFVPVDFSSHFTSRIQDRAGCAYTYPAGPQVFGDVPFSIPPSGPNEWAALAAPANTLDLAVSIPSAVRVHTLINTAWGLPGPTSYARVEFFGDGGAYYRKDLVGDVDIRDFLQNTYTNNINGSTTTNVYYSTQCPQQWVRLDKQRYDLPAEFLGQRLNRILFTDNGAPGYQLIIVEGITVESACPIIEQNPTPASACRTGAATFSIAASGTGSLSYQWQVQTSPGVWSNLPTGTLPLACGGSAHADTPTSSQTSVGIVPCPGVNAYQVRCVVSSACGSVNSDAAAYSVCYANCDCSTTAPPLNVLDFACFLNQFASGDPAANCDGSTAPPILNVLDFACFLNSFATGCP